jgi:hypothetical protein
MPFGLVAVFGADFRVSDMTAKANWVLTDCVASSSSAQTVNAFCTDASDDSGCNAVFKKGAKDTCVDFLPLLFVFLNFLNLEGL